MLTALVSFVVTGLATPLARALAIRARVLDVPNARSSHLVPTPRSGGLAIALGVAAAIATTVAIDSGMAVILAGAGVMTLMGAVDDVRALPWWPRLVAQIVTAAVVTAAAGLALPLPPTVHAATASAAVLTVIWIVGATNAFNFMDGINGIGAGQAIVTAGALALLADRHGDAVSVGVLLAIGGAAAGFLPWNYPRAAIFMGDAGSALLGFALAAIIVRLAMTAASTVAVALPLAPFLLDTSITFARRLWRGEAIHAPHRSHFYQRQVALGSSHGSTTAVWMLLALLSGAAGLVYDRSGSLERVLIVGGVVIAHALIAGTIITAERVSRKGGTR